MKYLTNRSFKSLLKLVVFLVIIQALQEKNNLFGADSVRFGLVQISKKDVPLSFPSIELHSGDEIDFRFDVLETQPYYFYYSIELCDYNWETTILDPMEYLEGYEKNNLDPYSPSMNTTVDYFHYRLALPNDNINILRSGNYKLKIFLSENDTMPVLTERFVVYEDDAEVILQYNSMQSELYGDRQEFTASVSSVYIDKSNLAGNIKLCILQNDNWNTLQYFHKFNADASQKLSINAPGDITFEARNEYRYFDTKSLQNRLYGVEYFEFRRPYTHVFLTKDKTRGMKHYLFGEDLNGRFYIANQHSMDNELLDADYVYVHFFLETEYPYGADVYLDGQFSWREPDKYILTYNPDRGGYEGTFLLKQGIVNYMYYQKEYNIGNVDYFFTEGSYSKASNKYTSLLYYKERGEEYYRIIGVSYNEVNKE